MELPTLEDWATLKVNFDFCMVEFSAMPGVAALDVAEWVEVYCHRHEWSCGHRHRKWGPWMRCANRHQQEVAE